MARRIQAWLGVKRGERAEVWLAMQMQYDLWQAEQKPLPKVIPAPRVAG
jgi:plasmid maintenance system antidote protein VapI